MLVSRYKCKVLSIEWKTPSVFELRFSANRPIHYESGQFLSIYGPGPESDARVGADRGGKRVRRPYSFATPAEIAVKEGYLLCVKHVAGGAGSSYLASLKPGSQFEASAPFGGFLYEPLENYERNLCLISTGTGIAPLRAIALSTALKQSAPDRRFNFFGARYEDEIIYPGLFESLGFETVNAISSPRWPLPPPIGRSTAFKGRLTDYLSALPPSWPWQATDFYLCGSGEMIEQVKGILSGRGVDPEAIRMEAYFSNNLAISLPLKIAA